jgi:hypothetical protein
MVTSLKTNFLLEQIRGLIQQRNYHAAIDLINRSGQHSAPVENARGVCMLRMGEIDKATKIFRELVFPAGSICPDPDVPLICRTNFVTAMFLGGNLAAGVDVLGQVQDRQHPAVVRLYATLKTWKQRPGLFQRLGCLLNAYPHKPVRLDFPPGDLR